MKTFILGLLMLAGTLLAGVPATAQQVPVTVLKTVPGPMPAAESMQRLMAPKADVPYTVSRGTPYVVAKVRQVTDPAVQKKVLDGVFTHPPLLMQMDMSLQANEQPNGFSKVATSQP